MNKMFLIIFSLPLLSGCGEIERNIAQITGYSIICVKETGTSYVQFPSGVAPLMTKDGDIVPCK